LALSGRTRHAQEGAGAVAMAEARIRSFQEDHSTPSNRVVIVDEDWPGGAGINDEAGMRLLSYSVERVGETASTRYPYISRDRRARHCTS
jgi:hypothetical protein